MPSTASTGQERGRAPRTSAMIPDSVAASRHAIAPTCAVTAGIQSQVLASSPAMSATPSTDHPTMAIELSTTPMSMMMNERLPIDAGVIVDAMDARLLG